MQVCFCNVGEKFYNFEFLERKWSIPKLLMTMLMRSGTGQLAQ